MTSTLKHKSILVVRLGAMGDIIHALPAVISLKKSFPHANLTWVIRSRWMPLLEGNPYVDQLIPFDKTQQLWNSCTRLWRIRPSLAIDFQGLVQSALIGRLARPGESWGFDTSVARERLASSFYTHRASVTGPHRIERNLQLVAAAGATQLVNETWLPAGRPERKLPRAPFVLASPFAGWAGKQWPLDYYARLAVRLRSEGVTLLLDVPQQQAKALPSLSGVEVQTSSIPGLIHSTREAAAIVGVDSGPLHLAAALRKPGVAIFGPTDPAATGPYGGHMAVLRTPSAETTYDRHHTIQASMRAITPEQVFAALIETLAAREPSSARTL